MSHKKCYSVQAVRPDAQSKRTTRKHLNADALIKLMRKDFQRIPDHRAGNATVTLDDALTSALAMFQLKDPSLLAFDKRRQEPANLHTIWGIKNTAIPDLCQLVDFAMSNFFHFANFFPRTGGATSWRAWPGTRIN